MEFKKKESVIVRKIHGAIFLINIKDNYLGDRCALYEINQTGLFIWENLDKFHSVEELAVELKNAIIEDISYQIIFDDVMDFISILSSKDFLEVR